jgi:hypothetical protein
LGRIQDENSINIIKQATQDATPTPKTSLQNKTTNVPTEIKKFIADKRRARARWHRSQAPSDKTTYISNRLKCKIKEERDKYFTDYITSLNRFDNTIWKPIKYFKKKTKTDTSNKK